MPQFNCALCQISFYRENRHVNNSKSGLRFCSRRCKDEGQKLKYNLTEIWPHHYGVNSNYRKTAFDNLENKCNKCGFTKALIVHHKNRNRKDNSIENLEILCSNCHYIEHYN